MGSASAKQQYGSEPALLYARQWERLLSPVLPFPRELVTLTSQYADSPPDSLDPSKASVNSRFGAVSGGGALYSLHTEDFWSTKYPEDAEREEDISYEEGISPVPCFYRETIGQMAKRRAAYEEALALVQAGGGGGGGGGPGGGGGGGSAGADAKSRAPATPQSPKRPAHIVAWTVAALPNLRLREDNDNDDFGHPPPQPTTGGSASASGSGSGSSGPPLAAASAASAAAASSSSSPLLPSAGKPPYISSFAVGVGVKGAVAFEQSSHCDYRGNSWMISSSVRSSPSPIIPSLALSCRPLGLSAQLSERS
jgi:hypothetical protein